MVEEVLEVNENEFRFEMSIFGEVTESQFRIAGNGLLTAWSNSSQPGNSPGYNRHPLSSEVPSRDIADCSASRKLLLHSSRTRTGSIRLRLMSEPCKGV